MERWFGWVYDSKCRKCWALASGLLLSCVAALKLLKREIWLPGHIGWRIQEE
jgi:hypothetical protein